MYARASYKKGGLKILGEEGIWITVEEEWGKMGGAAPILLPHPRDYISNGGIHVEYNKQAK